MTVIVTGSFRVPPENLAKVRPHLKSLVEATRAHDGFIAYDAAEDLFDPGLIRFTEIWPDADLLAAHLKAPHIAPWRKAAADYGVHGRQFTAYDGQNPRPV
jgi:quinol monooxygenase YgiN